MAETKLKFKLFTIADFEEEEVWLREQHRNGWKLTRCLPFFLYKFEKCEPEDVIYRLDYQNGRETGSYMQMFRDFGWDYVLQFMGWVYFKKPATAVTAENEDKLRSDKESKYRMLQDLVKTRMLPIFILFFCSVVPTVVPMILGGNPLLPKFIAFICGFVFGFDAVLLIKSSRKLKKMLNELR